MSAHAAPRGGAEEPDILAELSTRRADLLAKLDRLRSTLHVAGARSALVALIGQALPVLSADADVLVAVTNRHRALRVRSAACVDATARVLERIEAELTVAVSSPEALEDFADWLADLLERGGELTSGVGDMLRRCDLRALANALGIGERDALAEDDLASTLANALGQLTRRGMCDLAAEMLFKLWRAARRPGVDEVRLFVTLSAALADTTVDDSVPGSPRRRPVEKSTHEGAITAEPALVGLAQ